MKSANMPDSSSYDRSAIRRKRQARDRIDAIEQAVKLNDATAIPLLLAALDDLGYCCVATPYDVPYYVAEAAMKALVSLGHRTPEFLSRLGQMFQDSEIPDVRRTAAQCLLMLGQIDLRQLKPQLSNSEEQKIDFTLLCYETTGGREFLLEILNDLSEPDRVRKSAADILWAMGIFTRRRWFSRKYKIMRRELPPQVEEWLRRDGWYPGRVDDKTDWAGIYREAGVEPPDAVLAFHREFGNLVLKAPCKRRIGLHPRWKIPRLIPSKFKPYVDLRLKQFDATLCEAVSTLVGPVYQVGHILMPYFLGEESRPDPLLMDPKANFYWVWWEQSPVLIVWARDVQHLLCKSYCISSGVKGYPKFIGDVPIPDEEPPRPHGFFLSGGRR